MTRKSPSKSPSSPKSPSSSPQTGSNQPNTSKTISPTGTTATNKQGPSKKRPKRWARDFRRSHKKIAAIKASRKSPTVPNKQPQAVVHKHHHQPSQYTHPQPSRLPTVQPPVQGPISQLQHIQQSALNNTAQLPSLSTPPRGVVSKQVHISDINNNPVSQMTGLPSNKITPAEVQQRSAQIPKISQYGFVDIKKYSPPYHLRQQQLIMDSPKDPKYALPSDQKPNVDTVMRLFQLKRDHRYTPEDYINLVLAKSTPSQLSITTVSEHYENGTPDMVYLYRGYKKLNKIDEGAFGTVWKGVRRSDGIIVAIKEVDLSRKRAKRIEEMKRELFVLQKVSHPTVVRMIEHFVAGQRLQMIIEYCPGGNLTSYLKDTSIEEGEARLLFKQMAISIKVLHRLGIAHRDVKLNNFLLDATKTRIKVADFGLSVVSYRRSRGLVMARTYCGTEPYMAPEILRRNSRGFRCYNPLYSDIWSLGICLYAMLTRTFPFKMNLSQRGLFKAQVARRWHFPKALRENLSDEIKDLVCHLLDPEADRRITINGVLQHPWLAGNELCELSDCATR